MSETPNDALNRLLALLFQAHPWHGVAPGSDAPRLLNAYIEIVPTDAVKYELDKPSGHLRIDRPQRFSSFPPTLYGFIPQSFCGERVAELCRERTGIEGIRGDGDPMDICVLTEKPIAHGDLFIRARPVGGLRMIDAVEADDKIVAVLHDDVAFGHIEDIAEVPAGLVDRLRHYFLTY
ncbi:MAG TPA: inorganic pyrophosphatase, partial [Pyrinomonadaceae bacterium]|nr:inorganic pyrophosphatase [Pyrinomonadaceae bacterium]